MQTKVLLVVTAISFVLIKEGFHQLFIFIN